MRMTAALACECDCGIGGEILTLHDLPCAVRSLAAVLPSGHAGRLFGMAWEAVAARALVDAHHSPTEIDRVIDALLPHSVRWSRRLK